MPKNPTLEQRIEWHLAHATACDCRAIHGKILEEIKRRGIKVPASHTADWARTEVFVRAELFRATLDPSPLPPGRRIADSKRVGLSNRLGHLIILAIASADETSFFFILVVSNCGYILFNFLNLNAAWMHRINPGHIERPYKPPTFVWCNNRVTRHGNHAVQQCFR
jgi:hypothetical protein